MSERVVVCAADDLAPGAMAAARLGLLPIVVVRALDGELHGYVDRCLHQGARLSGGECRLLGEREVLRCPWHGYEYEVRSGCATFDRRLALRPVEVRVEDGLIIVSSSEMSEF